MFQEKERLSALEKRYHSLTGGKSFPKSSTAMREVRELLSEHKHTFTLSGPGLKTKKTLTPLTRSDLLVCRHGDNLLVLTVQRIWCNQTNVKIYGGYVFLMLSSS